MILYKAVCGVVDTARTVSNKFCFVDRVTSRRQSNRLAARSRWYVRGRTRTLRSCCGMLEPALKPSCSEVPVRIIKNMIP